MKLSDVSRHEELDDIYMKVCSALDELGPDRTNMMLARLCLLLIGEVESKPAVEKAIAEAREWNKPGNTGAEV